MGTGKLNAGGNPGSIASTGSRNIPSYFTLPGVSITFGVGACVSQSKRRSL